MSLSNDVAEVALVVSLVALIISGLQLLQQLFGTSEGWSRCGPSVIGRWSRLRCSQWLWTEMRFETKFVTPRIIVLHGNSDLDWETPVSKLFRKRSWRPYALRKSSNHLHGRLQSIVKFWDASLGMVPKTKSMSFTDPSRGSSYFKTQLAVTWPELIHYLGRYHYAQIANTLGKKTSSVLSGLPWDKVIPGEDPSNKLLSVEGSQGENLPLLSSFVGLKLEEHSWDAMPPDVVRPMATISLGHLVIIAIRLGMRWRRTSVFDGLQATGALSSISSTMIPGLGIIALFNFTTADLSTASFRLLVPSKDADKLMCGVIPATPELSICTSDGRDIPLIDDDRTLKPMRDFLRYDAVSGSRWLRREGVHEKLMESITTYPKPSAWEWWIRAAVFDAWSMLCPFVPIERSSIIDIILPLPGEHMRTPLEYSGGRKILSLLFRDRFKPRIDNNVNADWIRTLLTCFEILDAEFPSSKRSFTPPEIVRRVALLRGIHERASQQLVSRQVAVPPLVGVHVLTVMSASKIALSNWNNDLGKVDLGFTIKDCVDKNEVDKDRMHLLAYCYAEEIETWKKHALDRDRALMELLGDDAELVWWTLIMRAMSWALSVRPNLANGPVPYRPVPSSLYGDPTPIWIM